MNMNTTISFTLPFSGKALSGLCADHLSFKRTSVKRSSRKRVTVSFCLKDLLVSLLCGLLLFLLVAAVVVPAQNSRHTSVEKPVIYSSIRVEAGDTLWGIAESYSTSVGMSVKEYIQTVKQLNHLESSQLFAGTYLLIPCGETAFAE